MGTHGVAGERGIASRLVALALLAVSAAGLLFAQTIVAFSQWYGWELSWLHKLSQFACSVRALCDLGFVRYLLLALMGALVAAVAFALARGRGSRQWIRRIDAVAPRSLGLMRSPWVPGFLGISLGIQIQSVARLYAKGELPLLSIWAIGIVTCGIGLWLWEREQHGASKHLRYASLFVMGYALSLVGIGFCAGQRWGPGLATLSVAMAALGGFWRGYERLGLRRSAVTWLVVLAIGLATLAVGMVGLESWRFSVIGDEWAFYLTAVRLIAGKLPMAVMSSRGTYGIHPIFSSWLQAMAMRLFGMGNYGWRVSNPLIIAWSVLPLYVIVRSFSARRVALVAAALFGASHYLMSFGKIGYNNVQALLPVLGAVAVWLQSARRGSVVGMWLAGAIAGLGFYVFAAGQLAIFVLLLLMCVYYVPWRRENWPGWLAMGAGLVVVALPALLEPKGGSSLLQQTVLHSTYAATLPEMLMQLRDNSLRAVLLFFTSQKHTHFVFGAHLDPLTSSLFILGLAVLAACWKRVESWILLLGFVGGAIALGGITQYDHPPNTRMFMLMPVYAAIAAIGCVQLVDAVGNALGTKKLAWPALVSLVIMAWALNSYIAYVVFPSRRPLNQECLLVRELQTMNAGEGGAGPLLVIRTEGDRYDLASYLLRAYDLLDVQFGVVTAEQVAWWMQEEGCADEGIRVWYPSQIPGLDALLVVQQQRCVDSRPTRLLDASGAYHYTEFVLPMGVEADGVHWITPWTP